MRRSARAARWAALGLLAGGVLLAGAGLAPYAKGWLGQRLLERAWAATQAGGDAEAARPWPWADGRPLARLTVPSLAVDLVVLDESSGRSLAWGPGHLPGSAAIGTPGVAVISAHRDSHFDFLGRLEPGMEFALETASGRRLPYRVVGAEIVDARGEVLIPQIEGVSTVALVTCWPFDATAAGTPWRYLVHAVPAAR